MNKYFRHFTLFFKEKCWKMSGNFTPTFSQNIFPRYAKIEARPL